MKYFISTIITVLLTFHLGYSQNIDNATKNKIRVKFITAEEHYNNNNYKNTLEKINEIEQLLGNTILPTALNLKIKALVGLREYTEAKKELTTLENLELDEAILKDISVYSTKIDRGIESDKLRIKKIQEQKIAEDKDEENWKKAKELNTKDAFEYYLILSSNKLFRKEAEAEIDKINWRLAIKGNSIISYRQYLNNSNNKLYRKKAERKIEEFELQTAKGLEKFYKQFSGDDNNLSIGKYIIKMSGSFYHKSYSKRIYYERWGNLNEIKNIEIDDRFGDVRVRLTGRFKRFIYIFKNGSKKEFVYTTARKSGYKKGKENYVLYSHIVFESREKAMRFTENFKQFLKKNRN